MGIAAVDGAVISMGTGADTDSEATDDDREVCEADCGGCGFGGEADRRAATFVLDDDAASGASAGMGAASAMGVFYSMISNRSGIGEAYWGIRTDICTRLLQSALLLDRRRGSERHLSEAWRRLIDDGLQLRVHLSRIDHHDIL